MFKTGGEVVVTFKGSALRNKFVLVGILLALAACGSSGSDDDIAERIAAGASLTASEVESWDNTISPRAASLFATEPVTPWSDVPDAGSADYDYVGGMEIVRIPGETDRVFGTMNASTDFASNSITGEATNFYSEAGNLQPGNVTLTANFDRTTDLDTFSGISGSLSGSLTGDVINGDVSIPIVVADFADSATVIYGGGEGTAAGEDVRAAFVLFQE